MVLVIGGSNQGKTDFVINKFGKEFIFDELHLFVRKKMDEGYTEEKILEEIREKIKGGSTVLIADEIGNGVVPMDSTDRLWREVTGRILIKLAAEATEVYRVVCGIGQRIK